MAKIIVYGGEKVLKLSSEFRGWPLTTVKWYKENQEISENEKYRMVIEASVAELCLASVSKHDAGTYTVVASSPCGEALLCADVCVEDVTDERSTHGETHALPPILLQPLTDQVIRVGRKAKLTVAASQPEVQIQWYKGVDKLKDDERYQVSHQGGVSTLDINVVEPSDEGVWRCEVIAAFGYAISLAKIQTIVPKGYRKPEFLDPLKALLTEQGTVSLECKVVGIPTPQLRWFKDGNEIKAGDMFNLRLQRNDDENSLGTYTCMAVNCMGKAVSAAQVKVTEKYDAKYKPKIKVDEPIPYFYENLEDKTIRVGDNLRFTVRVRTPPSAQVTWFKNSESIEASDKFHLTKVDDGIFHLDVTPIEFDDQGQWKCTAINQYGNNSLACNVELTIPKHYRSPEFVEDLQAIFTDDGLVSFECKVIGVPTPILRWYKDSCELKPGDVHLLSGSNSLGSYSCVAKNCMGYASSFSELTLEDIYGAKERRKPHSKQPPRFIQPLKDDMIILGTPFKFTVIVTCPPVPEVTWYKDNQRVDSSEHYAIRRERNGVYHLETETAEVGDQGLWKCLIVNDYGHSLTQCCLRVTVPRHFKKPVFIENLRAVLSEEGAVCLECKVIGVPQPLLKWYKDGVELKAGDIYKIVSGEGGTSCLGTYTCEARNCMGLASSTAALLAFDDKCRRDTEKEAFQHELSTIEERDEFSTYGTPSITDNWDEYKTDMEFSIYDTPDITENEARQIIEMFANEASEYVSVREAPDLPPFRFIKESAMIGNILMEALIIDVPIEHFSCAEEMSKMNEIDNMATEADIADISTYEPVIVDLPYDYSDAASLHELKISISEDQAAVKDASTAIREAATVEMQVPAAKTNVGENIEAIPGEKAIVVKQQPLVATAIASSTKGQPSVVSPVDIEKANVQVAQLNDNLENPEIAGAQLSNQKEITKEKAVKCINDAPAAMVEVTTVTGGEQTRDNFYSDEFTSPSENLGTEADIDSIASMEEFATDGYANGYADDELDVQDLEVDEIVGKDEIDPKQRVCGDESSRFTPTYQSAVDELHEAEDLLPVDVIDYMNSRTPVPQQPLLYDDEQLLDMAYRENGISNLLLADVDEAGAFATRSTPGLLAELAGSVLQKAAEGIMTGAVLAESLVSMAANLVLNPEEQARSSTAGLPEQSSTEFEDYYPQKDAFVATFVTKTETEPEHLAKAVSEAENVSENNILKESVNSTPEDAKSVESLKKMTSEEIALQAQSDLNVCVQEEIHPKPQELHLSKDIAVEEGSGDIITSPLVMKEIENLGLSMAKDAITTALLNLKNEISTQENIIKSLQDEPISASSDLSSLTDELEQLKSGKKSAKKQDPTETPAKDSAEDKSVEYVKEVAERIVTQVFENALPIVTEKINNLKTAEVENTTDLHTEGASISKSAEGEIISEVLQVNDPLNQQPVLGDAKTEPKQDNLVENVGDSRKSIEAPQAAPAIEEPLKESTIDQNMSSSPCINELAENMVANSIQSVISQITTQKEADISNKQQLLNATPEENKDKIINFEASDNLKTDTSTEMSPEQLQKAVNASQEAENQKCQEEQQTNFEEQQPKQIDGSTNIDSAILPISQKENQSLSLQVENSESLQTEMNQESTQVEIQDECATKQMGQKPEEALHHECVTMKESKITEDVDLLKSQQDAEMRLATAANRLAEELVAKCILDAFESLEEVLALLQKADLQPDEQPRSESDSSETINGHIKITAEVDVDNSLATESFTAKLAKNEVDTSQSDAQTETFTISKENPTTEDESSKNNKEVATSPPHDADFPVSVDEIPKSEGSKESKLRRSSRKEKRRRGSKKLEDGEKPIRQDSRDSSVGDLTSDDGGDSQSSCSDAVVLTSAPPKKYTRTTSGTDLGQIYETDEFGLELDRRRSLPNIKEISTSDIAALTDFEEGIPALDTNGGQPDAAVLNDQRNSEDQNKKNFDNSLTPDLEPETPSLTTQNSDTDNTVSDEHTQTNDTVVSQIHIPTQNTIASAENSPSAEQNSETAPQMMIPNEKVLIDETSCQNLEHSTSEKVADENKYEINENIVPLENSHPVAPEEPQEAIVCVDPKGTTETAQSVKENSINEEMNKDEKVEINEKEIVVQERDCAPKQHIAEVFGVVKVIDKSVEGEIIDQINPDLISSDKAVESVVEDTNMIHHLNAEPLPIVHESKQVEGKKSETIDISQTGVKTADVSDTNRTDRVEAVSESSISPAEQINVTSVDETTSIGRDAQQIDKCEEFVDAIKSDLMNRENVVQSVVEDKNMINHPNAELAAIVHEFQEVNRLKQTTETINKNIQKAIVEEVSEGTSPEISTPISENSVPPNLSDLTVSELSPESNIHVEQAVISSESVKEQEVTIPKYPEEHTDSVKIDKSVIDKAETQLAEHVLKEKCNQLSDIVSETQNEAQQKLDLDNGSKSVQPGENDKQENEIKKEEFVSNENNNKDEPIMIQENKLPEVVSECIQKIDQNNIQNAIIEEIAAGENFEAATLVTDSVPPKTSQLTVSEVPHKADLHVEQVVISEPVKDDTKVIKHPEEIEETVAKNKLLLEEVKESVTDIAVETQLQPELKANASEAKISTNEINIDQQKGDGDVNQQKGGDDIDQPETDKQGIEPAEHVKEECATNLETAPKSQIENEAQQNVDLNNTSKGDEVNNKEIPASNKDEQINIQENNISSLKSTEAICEEMQQTDKNNIQNANIEEISATESADTATVIAENPLPPTVSHVTVSEVPLETNLRVEQVVISAEPVKEQTVSNDNIDNKDEQMNLQKNNDTLRIGQAEVVSADIQQTNKNNIQNAVIEEINAGENTDIATIIVEIPLPPSVSHVTVSEVPSETNLRVEQVVISAEPVREETASNKDEQIVLQENNVPPIKQVEAVFGVIKEIDTCEQFEIINTTEINHDLISRENATESVVEDTNIINLITAEPLAIVHVSETVEDKKPETIVTQDEANVSDINGTNRIETADRVGDSSIGQTEQIVKSVDETSSVSQEEKHLEKETTQVNEKQLNDNQDKVLGTSNENIKGTVVDTDTTAEKNEDILLVATESEKQPAGETDCQTASCVNLIKEDEKVELSQVSESRTENNESVTQEQQNAAESNKNGTKRDDTNMQEAIDGTKIDTVEQQVEEEKVQVLTAENIVACDTEQTLHVIEEQPVSTMGKQWVDAVTKEKQKDEEEKHMIHVDSEQKVKSSDTMAKDNTADEVTQLSTDEIQEREHNTDQTAKDLKQTNQNLEISNIQTNLSEQPEKKTTDNEKTEKNKDDVDNPDAAVAVKQGDTTSTLSDNAESESSKVEEESKRGSEENKIEESKELTKDETEKKPSEVKKKKIVKKKKPKIKEEPTEKKCEQVEQPEVSKMSKESNNDEPKPVENQRIEDENKVNLSPHICDETLTNEQCQQLAEESSKAESNENSTDNPALTPQKKTNLENKLFGGLSIEEVESNAEDNGQRGIVSEPEGDENKASNKSECRAKTKNIVNIEELLFDDAPLETFVQNVRTYSRLRTINEVHETSDDLEDEHIVISALTPTWIETESSTEPHSFHSVSRHRIERTGDNSKNPKGKYSPQFIMKLKDLAIPEEYRMRLTCCVIGTPEPSVKWLKNGHPIVPGMGYREINDLGICVLEIPRCSVNDTAEYTCVASNEYGETSTTGTLTVKNKSKPVEIDANSTRAVINAQGKCGDSITMDCSVTGWPVPNVTWLKDEQIVTASDRVETSDYPSGAHRLMINRASLEDSGVYKCVATNHVGKDEVVTAIKVTGLRTSRDSDYGSSKRCCRPTFITKPHNRVVREGETVKFSSSIVGHPTPKALWSKDGNTLSGISSKLQIIDKDDVHTLTLTEVTTSDAGIYSVTASNPMGKVVATVKLDVVANSRATISTIRECHAYSSSGNFRRPGSMNRCYQITGFNVPQLLYPSSSSSSSLDSPPSRSNRYTSRYQ